MASQHDDLEAYLRANDALLALIRGERYGTHSPISRRRRAEAKLRRTRALLSALGDPQTSYPAVHVTGTSGKGSTSSAIAAILTAAGYRVGLRTSPYLQVATEKLQIGPSLIDAPSFLELTQRVLNAANRLDRNASFASRIGYGEAWSALAFLWFAERRIDVAVVEVGAGGRFDTTNVIDGVVSVITSVGLDHVVSLGPTIADIAWHKSGIIKPGSIAIVGDLPDDAMVVVAAEARAAGVAVVRASALSSPGGLSSTMAGAFQKTNALVAESVIAALATRGFAVPTPAIAAGLAATRMPGRLERMPGSAAPEVWIDGAHNPDKARALARELGRIGRRGAHPVLVLGILGAKDETAIASALAPVASAIVCTQPTVTGKRSLAALDLTNVVRACGFAGDLWPEPNPDQAVQRAETLARERGTNVVVAGSMYLAGQVRDRWYRASAIVRQRTPWPVGSDCDRD